MTLQNGIKKRLRPMSPKLLQPRGPMSGSHATNLSQSMEGLWTQMSGSRRSFGWVSPDVAPRAVITQTNQQTDFGFPSALIPSGSSASHDLVIPWYQQESHDRVEILALLAHERSQAPPRVGAYMEQIVSGGFTNTEAWSMSPTNAEPITPTGLWAEDPFRFWVLRPARVVLKPSSVPSSRIYGIVPTVFINDRQTRNAEMVVSLYGLEVRDLAQDPT